MGFWGFGVLGCSRRTPPSSVMTRCSTWSGYGQATRPSMRRWAVPPASCGTPPRGGPRARAFSRPPMWCWDLCQSWGRCFGGGGDRRVRPRWARARRWERGLLAASAVPLLGKAATLTRVGTKVVTVGARAAKALDKLGVAITRAVEILESGRPGSGGHRPRVRADGSERRRRDSPAQSLGGAVGASRCARKGRAAPREVLGANAGCEAGGCRGREGFWEAVALCGGGGAGGGREGRLELFRLGKPDDRAAHQAVFHALGIGSDFSKCALSSGG